MLWLAFAVLSAAVALGTALALLHLRGAGRPPWKLAALHGGAGAAGLAALLVALGGLARPPGPFGWDAAGLLGLALAAGIALLAVARREGVGGPVIALHAILAVLGYVMLAAFVWDRG